MNIFVYVCTWLSVQTTRSRRFLRTQAKRDPKVICKMERRTATNTGFAAGALVEFHHWTSRYCLSWFADSKGVLSLRPQRGRLSKFQSADSPEYLVAGARVKLKNKNIYGRISYNGECSDPKKRRVEWSHKVGSSLCEAENLQCPRREHFAQHSWLVSWEDGSQKRVRQEKLFPVGAPPPIRPCITHMHSSLMCIMRMHASLMCITRVHSSPHTALPSS